jgi:hypothetical protein
MKTPYDVQPRTGDRIAPPNAQRGEARPSVWDFAGMFKD